MSSRPVHKLTTRPCWRSTCRPGKLEFRRGGPHGAAAVHRLAPMSDEILDVAVVGGGISRVYTAWRLLADGPQENVQVFESSARMGARLLSPASPDLADIVRNLGGLAF